MYYHENKSCFLWGTAFVVLQGAIIRIGKWDMAGKCEIRIRSNRIFEMEPYGDC